VHFRIGLVKSNWQKLISCLYRSRQELDVVRLNFKRIYGYINALKIKDRA